MKKRLMAAAAATLALVMAVPSPVLADEPSGDISYMGSTDATEVNVCSPLEKGELKGG